MEASSSTLLPRPPGAGSSYDRSEVAGRLQRRASQRENDEDEGELAQDSGEEDETSFMQRGALKGRRIQAIVEAYSTPGKVDWSDAKAFTGEIDPEGFVDPALRSHVFLKEEVELKLQQTREKTRELCGAPVAEGEGEGDGPEEAPKGAEGVPRGKQK